MTAGTAIYAPAPARDDVIGQLREFLGAASAAERGETEAKIQRALGLSELRRQLIVRGQCGDLAADFIRICLDLQPTGISRTTYYKLLDVALAVESGIVVPDDDDARWETLRAAGQRLRDQQSVLPKQVERAAAVQKEVDDGVARIRAAKPREQPEGTVAVLLPDVTRGVEEELHRRVRTVAAAHRLDVPGGAPELRAMLLESLAALPDDVLPAALDGWKGWTVLRDDALQALLKRAGMA
ncbi:hypothetical protein [Deinococcus fonticola]|uniref:hypothetical protein n=1 Tax=Deinococcus fonticola TaxID=2528713 RepID=UPI0010756D29|nr:hypothetical protein [Deinococcus fonticola]